MPIPSQDQLVNYLENSYQQPTTNEEPTIIEPIEPAYQTGLLTSTKARKITRKNLKDLEKLTGETLGITI